MRALWLAALLAAPARASRPLTPAAPEFPAGAAWINSKPLSLALMRERKVVLVAFIDPMGLHSIRLLPVLKAWFDRYALSQLMVVGVVSPGLEIEKNAAWVRAEMKRLGVEFPVVVDADRTLWKSYANDGWPTLYVVDRKGRIVFDHVGEGSYGEIETEMREALAGAADELPEATSPPEPKTTECGHATSDVAAGTRASAAPLKLESASPTHRKLIFESREGELSTRGKWAIETDGLRSTRPAPGQRDLVRVVYAAAQALAVLAPPPGKKTRFFVKLDDQWLYEGIAGRDVRYDDDGRSFVQVDAARLYDLARDSGDKPHELDLIPDRAGGAVHGFEFADACIASALP
ncbi:MAG: hypothetical protein ACHQ49_08385 [Elusimicrobiota bacterium]